jgi:hypothetical protein
MLQVLGLGALTQSLLSIGILTLVTYPSMSFAVPAIVWALAFWMASTGTAGGAGRRARMALRAGALSLLGSILVWPSTAHARPRYVQWMTPEPASQAPAPQVSAAAGDGGFTNNGYVPWQGGPIIAQLKVAAVLWGDRVDAKVASDIGGFYDTLTTGSFMHFVSEYATPDQTPGAYGTVLGTFTIQPNNAASVLTDADILTELSQQIAGGALPANDMNTVYMVHLPPGVSIDDPKIGKSCVSGGFCGYHKSGNGIIYSVLPDTSQGGCAPGPANCTSCCGDRTPFESATLVASHELMESITDPLPTENLAWDNVLAGEIADLCVYAKYGDSMYTTVYARSGRSYAAQKGFSNAAYVQHMGSAVGCIDYPTTLCCNDAQGNCTWLANGASVCPDPTGDSSSASTVPNGIVVTAPTLGGFGDGTALVTRQVVDGPPFPLGITDLLQGAGGSPVTSPTIAITSNTALVGASTACFAFVKDATQNSVVQCVPAGPAVPCDALGGSIQQGASGPQCCVDLHTQTSPDGTQLCARFPILGTTVTDLPALPGRAALLGGMLLVGLGTMAARRRLMRPDAPASKRTEEGQS